jgi:hypothetical protein
MTQKELLYVEDAIGHEKSIISILNDTESRLEEESLKSFIRKEKKKHESMLNELVSFMEECINE